MNNFQKFIFCPYCREELRFRYFSKKNNFGIAACICDEYPIVEGIIYLLKDSNYTNKKAVKLIRKGRNIRAVWECLKLTPKAYKLAVFAVYLIKKYTGWLLPLKILLSILYITGPARSWIKYLQKRESHNDYKYIIETFPKRKKPRGCVVDIGCGIGHVEKAFMDDLNKSATRWIALDKSFFSIFIAFLYHRSNNIQYICCDVEAGIPVPQEIASDILLIDSFTWIYSKRRLIVYISEVLRKKGRIWFVNVNPSLYQDGYGINANILKKILLKYFSRLTFTKYISISGVSKVCRSSELTDSAYICEGIKDDRALSVI